MIVPNIILSEYTRIETMYPAAARAPATTVTSEVEVAPEPGWHMRIPALDGRHPPPETGVTVTVVTEVALPVVLVAVAVYFVVAEGVTV